MYREIFPDTAWLQIAFVMLAASAGFILIGKSDQKRASSPLGGIGLTGCMFMQLSYDDVLGQRPFSFKILLLSTSIWFYVFFTYYTGDLTAREMVQPYTYIISYVNENKMESGGSNRPQLVTGSNWLWMVALIALLRLTIFTRLFQEWR